MKNKLLTLGKCLTLISATLLLVIFSSPIAFSIPVGTLDNSFGQNGIVISPVGNQWNGIRAITIQPDGKILAGGFAFATQSLTDADFALTRFNADGSIDTSFGVNGRVITPIRGFGDEIYDLEILGDGKIIAAGLSNRGASAQYDPFDIALASYNPDGTLDTSFGTNGITIAAAGNAWGCAKAIAIQKNGKIVTAGNTSVARFNSNGTIDASFGNGGIILISNLVINSMIIHEGDKIIVGGRGGFAFNDFVLARFNSAGAPDLFFGTRGRISTNFGNYSEINSLAVQSGGKIIAAGSAVTTVSDSDFALARYNVDGSLDTTFGNGGAVITAMSHDRDVIWAVSTQSNGKIIAAGSAYYTSSNTAFALAEYNQNGSLNRRFGNFGKIITPVNLSSEIKALAIKQNGKIVVGGSSYLNPNNNFTLAQYHNSWFF